MPHKNKKGKSKKFKDNDEREEKVIKKVMGSSGVSKGSAIAILKSKGVLKQKKGERGLLIKKKSKSVRRKK